MTHKDITDPRKIEEFTEGDPLKSNGDTTVVKSKRSCGETCVYVIKNITVEPVMALFVLGCVITMLTTQNLSLEKACRVNLNFTDEICNSLRLQELESANEYEKATQKLLAKFISARTYISATIPCLITLFAGSYADKTGRRKIFILIPVTGQILVCLNNMLNTYFFHQLNLEFLTFSEAILEGFSGGWCLCFFVLFCFISAITTEKTRTFRMGMLNFALTVGFPIGMGASGILLKKLGYYGAFGIALSCHVLNFIYTGCILKAPERSPEEKKHDNKGVAYFFKLFFNINSLFKNFKVVFRGNRRYRLTVYMIVTCLLFGPVYGDVSIMYLNTRYRFNWDEVQFSLFQSYNFITHTVGTMFSITVFSKLLGWHDSILGIISTVSKVAGAFVFCFAPTGRIFFVAPLVEILNGTSLLAMRSLVSKLVDPNELGKANALISLMENVMPLAFVPLYTGVYRATMDVLPGAVFLLGAVSTLPALAVFIWLLCEHRRNKRKAKYAQADELLPKNGQLTPN